MKLYTIALTPMDLSVFVYAVKEVCTLHCRGVLIIAASCFLTICATQSLVLILISGLRELLLEYAARDINLIACLALGLEEFRLMFGTSLEGLSRLGIKSTSGGS